jgi:hypothetical protein
MLHRLRVISIVLIAVQAVSLWGQQPASIELPLSSPDILNVGDLRPTNRASAELPVTNRSGNPVRVTVKPGTMFRGRAGGGGGQDVMTLSAASLVIPPAGAGGGGGLGKLALDVLCVEANRPPFHNGDAMPFVPRVPDQLAHVVPLVERLDEGVQSLDSQIARLAGSVTLQVEGGASRIQYNGAPLSTADAHLLDAADWSPGTAGQATGRLNRAVVVQFALWSLTDNYTQADLGARLKDPQYAFAQPRAASISWAVRRLLETSGFKPQLFETGSVDNLYNRGVALLEGDDARGAADAFAGALAIEPGHYASLFNQGLAEARLQRMPIARLLWRRAAQVNPGDADVWLNLGAAAYQLGDLPDAESCYARAAGIPGHDKAAEQWLERVRLRLQGGNAKL